MTAAENLMRSEKTRGSAPIAAAKRKLLFPDRNSIFVRSSSEMEHNFLIKTKARKLMQASALYNGEIFMYKAILSAKTCGQLRQPADRAAPPARALQFSAVS